MLLLNALILSCALSPGVPGAAGAPLSQAEPERPWTLMIYGAADNNADGPILGFLDDIRAALDNDPGMELLLFIDRSEHFSSDASVLGEDFTGARVYRLRRDTAELLDASEFFPGMTADEEYEVDSADPENIGRFVAFGKQRFPARNYGLMIYSHADGCTMCPDEESGRSMNIPQLTDWVDSKASVDFLALELCNMGGIEIAYQWRPDNGGFSANILVAIPNAGPPLDWDRAFRRIRTPGHGAPANASTASLSEPQRLFDPASLTAAEFGKLVVEEGGKGRHAMLERYPDMAPRLRHEAAACYDLSRASKAKQAIDRWAVTLADANSRQVMEELRDGDAERNQSTVMNYRSGEFALRPYADIHALLQRAAASERLSDDSRAAATEAMEAVDELVLASFGMSGFESFTPGQNGLFISFPDGDAEVASATGPTRIWAQMGWYTPLASEVEGEGEYGRWAFLEDGATPENGKVENWFELLDYWFDDTSESPQGLNRYAY